MPLAVYCIRLVRVPAKVARVVIQRVAVSVAAHHAPGFRARERFQHDLMDFQHSALADGSIARPKTQVALNRINRPILPVVSHAPFAASSARDLLPTRLDSAESRDSIGGKPDDRPPKLVGRFCELAWDKNRLAIIPSWVHQRPSRKMPRNVAPRGPDPNLGDRKTFDPVGSCDRSGRFSCNQTRPDSGYLRLVKQGRAVVSMPQCVVLILRRRTPSQVLDAIVSGVAIVVECPLSPGSRPDECFQDQAMDGEPLRL